MHLFIRKNKSYAKSFWGYAEFDTGSYWNFYNANNIVLFNDIFPSLFEINNNEFKLKLIIYSLEIIGIGKSNEIFTNNNNIRIKIITLF